MDVEFIAWIETLGRGDVALAGGKAASLGELSRALRGSGALLPRGFAVTAAGYRAFAGTPAVAAAIERALSERAEGAPLAATAAAIRRAMEAAPLPADLDRAIREAYRQLAVREEIEAPAVAVRSSATAEDLPGASFAGQHASFLGVRGEDAVVGACRSCFASLFTERAVAYRERMGFDHRAVVLAVAVHTMLAWPDCEAAGVMFTLDPETGFPEVVVVDGNWGAGEAVVQGQATPDEFTVFKPALEAFPSPVISRRKGAKAMKAVARPGGSGSMLVETSTAERASFCLHDADVIQLARWAVLIERHYGQPMDIEWLKQASGGRLGIVQARPETVHAGRVAPSMRSFTITAAEEPLVRGIAVGTSVASGTARVVRGPAPATFEDGDVLVTAATSPDWVPLMRRASAVVTDLGGRTSHAAIVSRELGIPAVVGSRTATTVVPDGAVVTVSCAEGREGRVYRGALPFASEDLAGGEAPQIRTRVMINLSIPDAAFRWWRLPADGVGLARIEFIIGEWIRAHPMALLHPERIDDEDVRTELARMACDYPSGAAYFVDQLAQGIAMLAAPQYPRPVVVRLSDFKSNEYANLVGGRWFEPPEPNPMLGLRGASRYYHERYREAFGLECRAILRARDEMGLDNVVVMIPFCRTVDECDRVLAEMAANGLVRGEHGLKVWLMCEIPSNVVLAAEFARRVDGFSIGSNDLTQLVLGVDRDSADLRALFDERDPAVKAMIRSVIRDAHAAAVPVSFCGQAPTDDPEFAAFLVECGIDSVSVSPDAVLRTRAVIAAAEAAAPD